MTGGAIFVSLVVGKPQVLLESSAMWKGELVHARAPFSDFYPAHVNE